MLSYNRPEGKAQGQAAAGGPGGRCKEVNQPRNAVTGGTGQGTLKTEIVWPETLETGPGK